VRENGPVTDKEVLLQEGALLVSQTDTGGRILFANDAFVTISGYSHDELIGAPHNLVRHPHMPQAAFRDLWATVKAGRPWEGLVKNRTKTGDYYWVRANVTPVIEDGTLTGYISIRTKPGRDEVAAAEGVYRAMREERSRNLQIKGGEVVRTGLATRLRRATRGIVSGTALSFAIVALFVAVSILLGRHGVGAVPRSLMLLCVGLAVACFLAVAARRLGRAFIEIEAQFAAVAHGDLKSPIEPVAVPELQKISQFLRALRARLAYAEEVRVQREHDAHRERVEALRSMADTVEATANETAGTVAAAASAMQGNATQMTGAAADVNANAAAAAEAATEALASTQNVAAAAEELAASISEIANQIVLASKITAEAVTDGTAAGHTISALQKEVEHIGQIASLIANIANQTNLLALNATIEAARAGEAGRGFAVVASEVKKLASETAKATDEISHQIGQIRGATTQTVDAVTRIAGKVDAIDKVSSAIAAAMEEQSATTQEISRSVARTAHSAQSVTDMMADVARHAQQATTRADQVCNAASALAEEADQSRQSLVRAVRTSVADADRRMHQRLPTDTACVLVVNGRQHSTRLADLSQGGACLNAIAGCAVGDSGELRVAALGIVAACTVVATSEDEVRVAFTSAVALPASLAGNQAAAA